MLSREWNVFSFRTRNQPWPWTEVIWKPVLITYSLMATTVPSWATVKQIGQKILSRQHLIYRPTDQPAGAKLCPLFFQPVPLYSLSWWDILFMPPFEKMSYIVLHLSVVRSVDQAMSPLYLLTPLRESCQTWYSGCP